MKLKLWLLPSTLCLTGWVAAQEMASVLPRRVHRTRFVNVFVRPVRQAYNGDGKLESIVAPLNRTVDLGQMEAGLSAVLETGATINTHLMYFAFERGISPRLSGGIKIPFVQQDIDAQFRATLEGPSVAPAKMATYAQAINTATFEQELFTSRGYKVPGNFKMKSLGDVEAGLKYQAVKSRQDLLSVTAGLRFPTTSHKTDYTNVLDKGVNGITDNQLDLGLQAVNDFLITDNFILGSSVFYTFQFRDRFERPVFVKGDPRLPNLNDRGVWDRVSRDMGDLLETEVSLNYNFLQKSLSVWSLYQWKYKLRDRFNGSRPDTLDYARLENGTDYSVHRYEIGVGYTTVPAYTKNKIFAPFDVRLSYNDIFKAKNTPRSPYTRLDLWAYF